MRDTAAIARQLMAERRVHRIHAFQLVLPQTSRAAPWETHARRYLSAKRLVERGDLHLRRNTWISGNVL